MLEVKRIDPESAGKVVSLILSGIVLILGIVYILLILVTLFLTIVGGGTVDNAGLLLMILGGIGTTLFMLIVFAIVGYVKGWIVAALYNWVAHGFGGLEIEVTGKTEVKAKEEPAKKPKTTKRRKTRSPKKRKTTRKVATKK